MSPATVATFLGPTLSCHNPPTIVPTPRKNIASVKFSCTCVSDQCSACIRGILKTLQPYTAPRQICMITAATAMPQRLGRRSELIESSLYRRNFEQRISYRHLRCDIYGLVRGRRRFYPMTGGNQFHGGVVIRYPAGVQTPSGNQYVGLRPVCLQATGLDAIDPYPAVQFAQLVAQRDGIAVMQAQTARILGGYENGIAGSASERVLVRQQHAVELLPPAG